MRETDNLILSAGYNYPPEYLRTFLKSIARNMKSADVVLFYHDPLQVSSLREYLETVRVVTPSNYSINGSGCYGPHFARYFWALDYCEQIDIGQYKRLMLCDSRDVGIQNDVF